MKKDGITPWYSEKKEMCGGDRTLNKTKSFSLDKESNNVSTCL